MQYTTHKIGDTYSRARLYALGAGVWTAASSVYGPGGVLVQALSCTLSALPAPDAAGNTHALAVLSTPAQTALWPAGALISDVVFTDASGAPPVVQSAEPYVIRSGRYAGATDSDNPLAVLPAELATVLRGADGLSAYQLAVAGGFVGTEAQWRASLVGPAGATSWDALEGKPTFGDAAGKNTGTVAGTVAAGDHGHTAAQVGAIPTGGLKTVNGNALEGAGDIAVSVDLASPGPIGGTTPSTIGATTGTYSGGSRTTSGSTLTITETLNNAAVAFPGALIVDQADTASASGSLIADFRSGGASKAAIRKDGAVKLSGPSSGYALILGTAQYREMSLYLGYDLQGGAGIALGNATATTAYSGLCPNGVTTGSAGRYGWSSGSAIAAGWDTAIGRNAAGVVEVNNGTSGDFRDLKLRNLIATGRIDLPQYTTATRPAVVNGAMIFDSDLDKLLIGGASAWEVVTSV